MKLLPTAALLVLLSCHSEKRVVTRAEDPAIGHYGRTVIDEHHDLILIGSASYAEFRFGGDSCVLLLKNIAPGNDDYNYVSIELDNQYAGRLKIDGNTPKPFTIKATTNNSSHLLRVYKATESHNGQVALTGVTGKNIKAAEHPVRKKIEFIGDSHTAAMASDTKEIPCGTGKWYDQHNAYWSYGPRVARALGADFLVSAVSGIGIYRNWNSTYPVMPQVYESAYLEIDSAQRWNFNNYIPDVVSICLGTNDFSNGDGKNERLPFDSAAYIKSYLAFIGTIYKHYPSTQIALLTSCTVSGEDAGMLLACLQSVQARSKYVYPGKPPVEVFQLKVMVPKGCGYHPDLADHEALAMQLEPFFKKLLEK